jgi:hypothetical protein
MLTLPRILTDPVVSKSSNAVLVLQAVLEGAGGSSHDRSLSLSAFQGFGQAEIHCLPEFARAAHCIEGVKAHICNHSHE